MCFPGARVCINEHGPANYFTHHFRWVKIMWGIVLGVKMVQNRDLQLYISEVISTSAIKLSSINHHYIKYNTYIRCKNQ